jgi:nitrite reductase/ring-hydroxylating ferredoxin subunit
MAVRKKETNRGFSGYFRTGLPEENAELTHVGPGTPCGEYLRRYWQPIALSSEVKELPVAIRIMGEDLVLFRDRSGELGLLHRHCSHRGASLEYGLIMEHGISCCYHGWHYSNDGTILVAGAEPRNSKVPADVVHGAYPTHEYNGLIFAYMGPPDEKPEFPVYDTYDLPETESAAFSLQAPCNWLQVYENHQDPIHTVFLHTRGNDVHFGQAWGEVQVLEYFDTPVGMSNVQTRRWGDLVWCRTVECLLPNGNQTGAIWEQADQEKFFRRVGFTRWMVPVDDTNTITFGWRYYNDLIDPQHLGDISNVGKEMIDFIGQTEDERSYEERQRNPGDFEAQVSQRPIALHDMENLGTTDQGVAKLRTLIRRGIQSVEKGRRLKMPLSNSGRIPTYGQDTVFKIAKAKNDRALLGDLGRKISGSVVNDAHLPPHERETAIRRICESSAVAL